MNHDEKIQHLESIIEAQKRARLHKIGFNNPQAKAEIWQTSRLKPKFDLLGYREQTDLSTFRGGNN